MSHGTNTVRSTWPVVWNVFYFHSYLGRWSNLTSIFFRWVGSTTNQMSQWWWIDRIDGWNDGTSVFFHRFDEFEVENHFWQLLDAVRGVSVSWHSFLMPTMMGPNTPWKINMEHVLMGVWKINFLSFHGWLVCSMLIFQGVTSYISGVITSVTLRSQLLINPTFLWLGNGMLKTINLREGSGFLARVYNLSYPCIFGHL